VCYNSIELINYACLYFFKTLTCRLFDRGHGGQRKHRTGRAIF
jgi:hypothetical protein